MSVKFRIGFLLMLSGLFAVLFFSYSVLGQEIDKERAISIVQTQGGPGGCTDEISCSAFCENPDNFEICVQWAQDNGLMRSREAEKAKRLARQARDFSGPGGCSNPEECRTFCENPENHDICLDFAVEQGFMTSEEADRIREFRKEAERFREETERGREGLEKEFEVDPEFDKEKALQIVESQGGPGGCSSFEECEAFCENPQNQETCFKFAEEHGLFKNSEHAQKIKKVLSGGGPGGCRGESQCRKFCENPENFEVCIDFAEKNEFIKPEEVEKARKGIRALREGGPGGCRTPKECEEVCRTEANQEVCFEWAKRHGLMSEDELRRIEEFKRRGEELRKEFEQRREEFEKRGEEFRPPEGFRPPGEFLGPAGCVGAEECRKYCEDPAHQEECQSFRTPTGDQPPGFGGTPPPEGIENYPEPKEHICPLMPEVECKEGQYKKIFYNPDGCSISECVSVEPYPTYSPSPEPYPYYSPTPAPKEEPSILQETGGYILKSFKEFFR